jgi:hypothetical protein
MKRSAAVVATIKTRRYVGIWRIRQGGQSPEGGGSLP